MKNRKNRAVGKKKKKVEGERRKGKRGYDYMLYNILMSA